MFSRPPRLFQSLSHDYVDSLTSLKRRATGIKAMQRSHAEPFTDVAGDVIAISCESRLYKDLISGICKGVAASARLGRNLCRSQRGGLDELP